MSAADALEFQEWSAGELAQALLRRPEDVVEIEVQAPDGTVMFTGLMDIAVGEGADFDRSGVYQWVKVVARLEPSRAM